MRGSSRGADMSESEICRMYRQARDKGMQIQILAELNAVSKDDIVEILRKNGERVRIPIPLKGKKRTRELTEQQYHRELFKRLDELDRRIAKAEKEYRMIAAEIKGARECGKTVS